MYNHLINGISQIYDNLMYNQVAFYFLDSLVVTTTYLKDVKKNHEEQIPRCMNNSIILWENTETCTKLLLLTHIYMSAQFTGLI